MIEIEKVDEVYIRIKTDEGIDRELVDYFAFFVPNYQFMPAFKSGHWDGRVKLYSNRTQRLYSGLLPYVRKFAKARGYKMRVDRELKLTSSFSRKEMLDFIDTLKLPHIPTNYQKSILVNAIRNYRNVYISPTGSGKSLIIYLVTRYLNMKTLIIVPTKSLVHQMIDDDFTEYSKKDKNWDVKTNCHMVMAGIDKQTDKQVVCSTWQSIYQMPKAYFDQFDVVIGDEAHHFQSKSLTAIMTKLVDCKYRFGFTGTLNDTETHKLILEGLFGKAVNVVTTKELIDTKFLSPLKIKAIVLNYDKSVRQQLAKAKYLDEVEYLIGNESRNIFIKNLCLSLKGNTLVLFQYVDKHGKLLYNLIQDDNSERKVFFVHGNVDVKDREQTRQIVEKEDDAIIVASYGTFSTGINIKRIHNIVFAFAYKGKIRNLQSIGRGLRKGDGKDQCTLIDIVDDLSYQKWKNYGLKHFAQRLMIYKEQEFPYKIYHVRIKKAHEKHSNKIHQTIER